MVCKNNRKNLQFKMERDFAVNYSEKNRRMNMPSRKSAKFQDCQLIVGKQIKILF